MPTSHQIQSSQPHRERSDRSGIPSSQPSMQNQRLATRVSNACDRCRRQKQRCDPFHPCSNCQNAGCECIHTRNPPTSTQQDRAIKRVRKPTSNPSPSTDSSHLDHVYDVETQSIQQSRDDLSERSPSHPETSATRSTSSPWIAETSWRERSIVSELGSSESAMDITRRVLQSRTSPQSGGRPTFAIPGGEFWTTRGSPEEYHSVVDLLGVELPPKETIDRLLDVYFFTVHWFSLVVHEPTFRHRYNAIVSTGLARSRDRPFLVLLLMILVMSCHYGHGIVDEELRQMADLTELRSRYLKVVRSNFMDLLDDDSLEFVQICTLLGSYWLYWGKPRSSFTILGAAIKAAQAISLHRHSNWRLPENSLQEVEECKRVWWTIYTWDRFATIVYGRPLGISDRDCDVPMPDVYMEHIVDIQTTEPADIELSPYQTSLNRIYQIASPILENIYAIRTPHGTSMSEMIQMVRGIDESMQTWSRQLPTSLDLDASADLPMHAPLREKMHQLQSLSLRLTYLNLMIIIHRPLLADWRNRRNKAAAGYPEQDAGSGSTESSKDSDAQACDRSFDQCLTAALAVSRLGQNKPNLVQLAGKTHLLSFFAMNVFTSSVVLFICALSNALSNAAQEAKRGMSRNLRILKSLSNAGSLSSQCSIIIEDLIQMIFENEKVQMLMDPHDSDTSGDDMHYKPSRHNTESGAPSYTSEPRYDAPQQSSALDPHSKRNWDTYSNDPSISMGRTMEQLHRVIKDASYHSRAQQRLEVSNHVSTFEPQSGAMSASGYSLPSNNPWDPNLVFGTDSFAPDMNQFWLWDMDLDGADMTTWPAANRDE